VARLGLPFASLALSPAVCGWERRPRLAEVYW